VEGVKRMKAVIFIGHGSKSSLANHQFIDFVQRAFDGMDTPIKGFGFLENAKPSIFQAVETAVQNGATEIAVVPVLLLPGVHASHDIPVELAMVKEIYPNLAILCSPPIGMDKNIINILMERLAKKGHKGEEILLIGHGSRAAPADEMLLQIAEILQNQIKCPVHTGFITTKPSYLDFLKIRQGRLFVIPYLLFSGRFLHQIEREIGNHTLCDPIGLDLQLQNVLMERVQQAKVI
jgi:sirohydrochlorin ferrochelatase